MAPLSRASYLRIGYLVMCVKTDGWLNITRTDAYSQFLLRAEPPYRQTGGYPDLAGWLLQMHESTVYFSREVKWFEWE
jgi:hypothetical protein